MASHEPLCRVFLSYSHQDRGLAAQVVTHLEDLRAAVWWDRTMDAGDPFFDVIKRQISRAHIFMPLLTPGTVSRPWVHQEIGYALASNVPVLPIAVGMEVLPGEMLQPLHAAVVAPSLADLRATLTRDVIEKRLRDGASDRVTVTYECASFGLGRTSMLVRCAKEVLDLERAGPSRVRCSGGLTSFAIPDLAIDHPAWDEREGEQYRRDVQQRQMLREERRVLARHARIAGCSLIIDPFSPLPNGPGAKRRRLLTLIEFLESLDDEQVCAAVRRRPPLDPANVLLVGDWFVATSVSPRPGAGYRETLLTWHAPTVRRSLHAFDEQLHDLLREHGVDARDSRRPAVATLCEVAAAQGA